MITVEHAIAMGSPADSDGSDDTEQDARSAPYNSLSTEAGRRGLGLSDEDPYVEGKCSPKDYQLVRNSVPCVNKLGSGCTDPFQTLPNLPGGDTEGLTHHWHTIFVNTTTPPGPRKRWFPSSIGDPALFHGIMHISAAHLAASQRSRPSSAYFQHRGEIIRLVNKRITYDQDATSDGTIGAIACLLISDSMSGHPERTRAHIAGIQQLVSARGGISSLHPLTQKLVRWNALLVSITFLEPPLFCPPQMIEPDLNAYYGPPSLSTASYALAFNTRLVNFLGQQQPSELAAKILWGLRNLSVLKETANVAESLSYDSISYSDRVEVIERETEKLLHGTLQMNNPGSSPKYTNPSLIFTLFSYATLIYINTVFRELVPSFITAVLAHRLELGMDLEDAELNILLGTFPELMLWMLFLGGGAARPKSKVWFAKTASKILRVKKIEEETSIATASMSFLWPEGRENYDDATEQDLETTEPSEVEVAFASMLPSAIITP